MADDGRLRVEPGAAWIDLGSDVATPYRRWPDRPSTPIPPFDLVDQLKAGGIPVRIEDDHALAPYRNAADYAGPRTPAIERLLMSVSALYAAAGGATQGQLDAAERVLAHVGRDVVEMLTRDDPWIRNFVLNMWEYVHGVAELSTFPWNVSLPIADICNARCTFCTSWIDGKALVKLKQIEEFAEVIRHAVYVGLVGHGEPLSHPQFDQICEVIAREMDPRCKAYTITNGVYLKKWEHLLDSINLDSISVSLNAATNETHDAVMGLGLGAFDDIVACLARLASPVRKRRFISITLVVTQQNLHEIPAFIRLGEEIGVSQIWLRSLLPQSELVGGLNYHVLPAYLHPEFERLKEEALKAIAASPIPVTADPATWGTPIFSPELQAAIDDAPPPMVSREAALRDRQLRNRTAEVFSPEAYRRRGRALPADEFSRVDFLENRTRVSTKTTPHAHALSLPVPLPTQAAGPGHLDIKARDVSGRLVLSLWDEARQTYVSQAFLDRDGEARLAFEAPNPSLLFLVSNAAEDRNSEAELEAPRLFLNGEPAGELQLTRSTVYDSYDRFDDGLNPLGRTPRFACKAVYYNFYVNEMYFRAVPCCYMTHVPGFEEIRFDGSVPFFDVWNAPAMVELRRRLKDGPLFGACRKCPEKW